MTGCGSSGSRRILTGAPRLLPRKRALQREIALRRPPSPLPPWRRAPLPPVLHPLRCPIRNRLAPIPRPPGRGVAALIVRFAVITIGTLIMHTEDGAASAGASPGSVGPGVGGIIGTAVPGMFPGLSAVITAISRVFSFFSGFLPFVLWFVRKQLTLLVTLGLYRQISSLPRPNAGSWRAVQLHSREQLHQGLHDPQAMRPLLCFHLHFILPLLVVEWRPCVSPQEGQSMVRCVSCLIFFTIAVGQRTHRTVLLPACSLA